MGMRAITHDRLCLCGVGGVSNCKSRLLSHEEQHGNYETLFGFVDNLCFHRCKDTTKTDYYIDFAFLFMFISQRTFFRWQHKHPCGGYWTC